jgi:hypothetical protein
MKVVRHGCEMLSHTINLKEHTFKVFQNSQTRDTLNKVGKEENYNRFLD